MHRNSPSGWLTVFCGVALLGVVNCRAQMIDEEEVHDIGSRLELFVDEYLIESMKGVTRELHSPERQGPVMIFDRPWEGWCSGAVTVFQDGDLCLMYYVGLPMWGTFADFPNCFGAAVTCYAESRSVSAWVHTFRRGAMWNAGRLARHRTRRRSSRSVLSTSSVI